MDKINEFAEWLEEKELSGSTIDTYSYAVKEFYGRYGELTKKNLINYKKYLIESRKPKTANNRCIAMNQYCIFMGKSDFCLKTIKIPKSMSVENVISKEKYNYLLSKLKEDGDERGYFMILFLGKTGARVSEFIRFKKSDLEKGFCEIWTKGKIRKILFPDSIVEESKDYFKKNDGEYLFQNRYGKQFTTRGISSAIKDMADRYGIDRDVMYPHSFRHLFAIEFLKQNQNIALLADLMGHESIDTTAIYLKLSMKEQAEQLNKAVNW